MKEPAFSEQIKNYDWKFMFYKDVKEAFEKNSKAKKIVVSDVLDKSFRELKDARKRQGNLGMYVI